MLALLKISHRQHQKAMSPLFFGPKAVTMFDMQILRTRVTVEKAVQNWIQYQGNVFHFPGGGTMFPNGASAYIDELASVIPLADGTIRTALDTGCAGASWGAYLMDINILTMSFAPQDSHEAQIQFALEQGVPAVIGVLGTIKLSYPSRSLIWPIANVA